MESDSSGEGATPYQTLLSSLRRVRAPDRGVKRRSKVSRGAAKRVRVRDERCEVAEGGQSEGEEAEELSESDSEECGDPFYRNLSYQLTDSDLALMETPPEPLLVPGHPLGHATLSPSPLPGCPLPPDAPTQIHLRARVLRRLCASRPGGDTLPPEEALSETQRHLLHHLGHYADILYARETHERHTELLEAVVAHLVSHVSKGRRLVLRNNQRSESEPPRDQGLVRPRVLILVPFRSSALRVLRLMARLCGGVTHRRRLEAEYGPGEDTLDPTKPPEYRQLFQGNSDDCFKMGVALYSDTLRLFAPFYASDIIVASPLGLRTLVGAGGDRGESDFLSSLEIVLLDQTDVFLMQNWSHVVSLLRATHQQPHSLHGTDIRRIRPWALEQRGRHYCQLLLLCHLATPEIHALFRARATSRHHKLLIAPPEYPGVLRHLRHQTPQVFKRLPACHLSDTSEKRFLYFTESILPDLLSGARRHILLFTPSYCDYLRVRNHLAEREHPFTHISEYSSATQARRATSLFRKRQRDTLLLTERLLFFRSPRLPPASHLLLYGPPTYPHLYPLLLAAVAGDTSATVTCLYAREDALSLLRILGPRHTDTLISHKSSTHLVCN